MAEATPRSAIEDVIFDYTSWDRKVDDARRRFAQAAPFPHIVLTDVLNPEVTAEMNRDFPPLDDDGWTHYKHVNEFKQGRSRRDSIPASLLRVIDELNSERFRLFLSRLTGIENLLSDPDFGAGGGLSACKRGGFLNAHTDFTVHPYHRNWRRRLNLIFYLNAEWDEAWGGHTELWDDRMSAAVVRILPVANSCLIFDTTPPSFHGHPDPLDCPEGIARKTLAIYYFTEDASARSVSTDYQPRPRDGRWRRLLIYIDRMLLRLYHRIKQKFGLSDGFASNVLKTISSLFRGSDRG